MTVDDDLHALRLERKWWRHVGDAVRASAVQDRIDVLEVRPAPSGVVVYAAAGVATVRGTA